MTHLLSKKLIWIKKNLSFDNKFKEIEAYWNNECAEHPSNNHCEIFVIETLTFRYSYA